MEGSFDAVTSLLRYGADVNSVRVHVINIESGGLNIFFFPMVHISAAAPLKVEEAV